MADVRKRLLISFFYHQKTDVGALHARGIDLFADSGGFSAMTQGVTLDAKDYAAWINRWPGCFTTVANLDVIGNAKASADNLARLVDLGVNAIPVFHTGSPWAELDRVINAGHKYIALGGLVGKRKATAVNAWVDWSFRMGQSAGVRYHGFGLSGWRGMYRVPWYSCDSSTWSAGQRFGLVPVYNGPQKGINEYHLNHARLRQGDFLALCRDNGIDPDGGLLRPGTRAPGLLSWLGAATYRQAEAEIRRLRGTVSAPTVGREDGLLLYLATGPNSIETLLRPPTPKEATR